MTWWDAIEREVIRRDNAHRTRHTITPREQQIAKMEVKILQERRKNGYCPAEIDEILEHWYQTSTGKWKVERVAITTQHKQYIYSELQKRLSSFGVNHMSVQDLRDILDMIDAVYQSADVQDLDKPIIDLR